MPIYSTTVSETDAPPVTRTTAHAEEPLRTILLMLLASATLAVSRPTPARAETGEFNFPEAGVHLLNGRWMAVSPMIGGGASQLGAPGEGLDPSFVGLRYSERKGFVTGMFFALLNSVAGGMAANSPKSVTTYESGNWIITETVYRSEAERQQMLDDTARASEEMMSAEDQSVDLELYSTSMPGGGEVSGYKLNLFFGAKFNKYVVLDVGMGWGSVDARFTRDDRQAHVHLSYFGIPFRLNVAAGPALIYAAWDLNILGEWSDNPANIVDEPARYTKTSTRSHLELGIKSVLFDRLLLEVGLTTPTLTSFDFGYRASVGIRF